MVIGSELDSLLARFLVAWNTKVYVSRLVIRTPDAIEPASADITVPRGRVVARATE
jgi:hypothetical protein